MKKLLFLCLLIPVGSCSKGDKDKFCYNCATFREKEYAGGEIKKDTIKGQLCEDADFVEVYKKNGTFNGEYYEVKNGDTTRFHLVMSTTCTPK